MTAQPSKANGATESLRAVQLRSLGCFILNWGMAESYGQVSAFQIRDESCGTKTAIELNLR